MRTLLFILFVLQSLLLVSQVNPNDHWVEGYTKSNGTRVSGYHRTNPNHTINDNFSTYPNVNPYTGSIGTVMPTTYPSYDNYDIIENTYNISTTYDYNIPASYGTHAVKGYEYYERVDETYRERTYEIVSLDNLYSNNRNLSRMQRIVKYNNRYDKEQKELIEIALNKLGYNVGAVDGVFTETTIEAIKDFQKANGLLRDGMVGSQTLEIIRFKIGI